MPSIPVDTRTTHWTAPDGHGGSFRPNGELTTVGAAVHQNRAAWSSRKPMLSARLFVGFNVGNKPTWKVDDLVRIVKRVRKSQGHAPDASFLLQKGIYTSKKSGKTVTENGAQVILLNVDGATAKDFEQQILALADEVTTKLKQEEVIVELQRGGIAFRTFGVVP